MTDWITGQSTEDALDKIEDSWPQLAAWHAREAGRLGCRTAARSVPRVTGTGAPPAVTDPALAVEEASR